MKTTVDLPDALLQQAKLAAVKGHTTLKQLIVEGLETVLGLKQPAGSPRNLSPKESRHFTISPETGLPTLKNRNVVVTPAIVDQIRESEGI